MKSDYQELKQALNETMETKIAFLSKDLEKYKEKLLALNPKGVLKRGYSISLDEDGNVIKDIKNVKIGQNIQTILENGKIVSTVKEKEGK